LDGSVLPQWAVCNEKTIKKRLDLLNMGCSTSLLVVRPLIPITLHCRRRYSPYTYGDVAMYTREVTRYPTDIAVKFTMETLIGEHHHYLKNAGRGGLCFEAHGWIQPGTNLRICIPFSDELCNTCGKIAWCRKDHDGYYLMGVKFEKCVRVNAINKLIQG
jgi:hypothetical protein